MDGVLISAFEIIFGVKPNCNIAEWQAAKMVLDNFNIPLLGEELAKQCIFQIINHIYYPNDAITKLVVGHAESLATELWPDLPDEPHMDQIAFLENAAYSSHR